MNGSNAANRIRKMSLGKSIFILFFLSLFIVGVLSVLAFLVLSIFGYIPLGELLSQIFEFFYVHYMMIPILLMVLLLIAIVVVYILALVMSYFVFKSIYSRV